MSLRELEAARLQRNRSWIDDLDDSFWEGHGELLEAAGAGFDSSPAVRLGHGSSRYVGFRRALLQLRQSDSWKAVEAEGRDLPGARFGKWAADPGEEPPTTLDDPRESVFPTGRTTYWQWRRALLARRFVRNREGVDTMVLQRRAAEAMRRALLAEREERDKFDDSDEASSEEEPVSAPGPRGRLIGRRLRLGVPHDMAYWRSGPHFGRGSQAEADAHAAEEEKEMEQMKARARARSDGTRDSAALREALLMDLPPPPSAMPPSSLQEVQQRQQRRRRQRDSPAAPAASSPARPPPPHSSPPMDPSLPLPTLRGVTALAFAPPPPPPSSSVHFAHGSDSGVIGLAEVTSGRQWATLRRHEGPVAALDWDPSGTYLLSAGLDKQLLIWAVTWPEPPTPAGTAGGGREEGGGGGVGGGARCVRTVLLDTPVTHARFFPLWPNLCVAARPQAPQKRGWLGSLSRGWSGKAAAAEEAGPGGAARGCVTVVNISSGKAVQELEESAVLTALTVAHGGRAVFGADTRGRVLEWPVTADPVRAMQKPLGARRVLFDPQRLQHHRRVMGGPSLPHWSGRGGGAADVRSEVGSVDASSSPHGFGGPGATASARRSGGPLSLRSSGGMVRSGGSLAFRTIPSVRSGSSDAAPTVDSLSAAVAGRAYWVRLAHRPYDSSLRLPALVGLDSMGHIRALTLEPAAGAGAGEETEYVKRRFADRDAALAGPHCSVALSFHTDCVVLASETGEVVVMDPHARTLRSAVVARLSGHVRPVTCVAWSPDEAWILTGDESGAILSWRKGQGDR